MNLIQESQYKHVEKGIEENIRRVVRSGVQLSCTETRFQKCSQRFKDSFKHSMLSLSMAYNAISCKKNQRHPKKIKIADFTL